jgi:Na+-driven multidrug efflux pump
MPQFSDWSNLFSDNNIASSSSSLVVIIINNSLKFYGGNMAIAVYGIVGRLVGFAIMPIFGVIQGYHPIAGFNYGAKDFFRVKQATNLTIKLLEEWLIKPDDPMAKISFKINFIGFKYLYPNVNKL